MKPFISTMLCGVLLLGVMGVSIAAQTPDEACTAAIMAAKEVYVNRMVQIATTAISLHMWDRAEQIAKDVRLVHSGKAEDIRDAAAAAEEALAKKADPGTLVGKHWNIAYWPCDEGGPACGGFVFRSNGDVLHDGKKWGVVARRKDGGYELICTQEDMIEAVGPLSMTLYRNGDRLVGTLHVPNDPTRDGFRVHGSRPDPNMDD